MSLDTINQPQATPKEGGEYIAPLVVKDILERSYAGRNKYGKYLQTNNGRDAMVDAYQEVLDLAMYLRQQIEENRSNDVEKASDAPKEDGISIARYYATTLVRFLDSEYDNGRFGEGSMVDMARAALSRAVGLEET